ncbi:MAG: hypothetical protein V7603_5083 [Micromonosporaceae bacterium]
MALIAVASAKGSPGATVSSLALTLNALRPCLMAECDPAGGDLLAGYLEGRQDADRGLGKMAVASHRDRLAEDFEHQLLDLDPSHPRTRLLLPGLTDPAQSVSLAMVWERLAALFTGLERTDPGYDVIADCGRLTSPNAPWPLLHRADLVLLVARPTMPSLRAAAVRAAMLRTELAERGTGADGLALLLVGSGRYHPREISRDLQVPVAAELPDDPDTARVLSFGGEFARRAKLMRAARTAAGHLDAIVRARRTRLAPAARPALPAGPRQVVTHAQ